MEWITQNVPSVIDIIAKVIAAAAAVAALTSTPKDDSILASIRKVIDMLALNWGNAKNADGEN